MSGLFSSPKAPAPAPLPPSPVIEEDKQRQRDVAAKAASIDLALGGRRSTIYAGEDIALAEQQTRVRRRVAGSV